MLLLRFCFELMVGVSAVKAMRHLSDDLTARLISKSTIDYH